MKLVRYSVLALLAGLAVAGYLVYSLDAPFAAFGKEVFVGDQWATEFGRFDWGLAPPDGSAVVRDHGTYMQVWRRQPDGAWRFAREVWNSSPAVRTDVSR